LSPPCRRNHCAAVWPSIAAKSLKAPARKTVSPVRMRSANGISRLLLKPYGAREISNAIREVVDSDKPDAHTS